MSATQLLYIILAFLVFEFIFSKILGYLNAKSWKEELPIEVNDLYDKEKFEKAKNYANENGKIGLISGLISFCLFLLALLFGWFGVLDQWIHSISTHYIFSSLLFFGVLGLISFVINLPFSYYSTFVIEEKYGFNKTDTKTFVVDTIKSIVLSMLIGGLVISALTWVFNKMPNNFWWIAWVIVSGISLFFAIFYTSLLLPIFNKLSPLEDGELRQSIEKYAQKVSFPLKNIFIMDGSKRSSKANAFFSGLGKKKAIVLYDTLLEEQSTEEITAILAHEVGHYKKKHIIYSIFLSLLQTGILFFVFGLLANNINLANALGANETSFHINLLGFMLLYSPISIITGLLMNLFSRKNEYEADNYAKTTYKGEFLISSLKKLSAHHLSNLTPHWLYVFVNYSHPTLVERIRNINK